MFIFFKTLIILFVVLPVILSQQIFEEKFTSCTFENNEFNKNERVLQMDRKLWKIIGNNRRSKDIQVKFSACDLPSPLTDCDSTAAACILNKKNPSKNILNAGQYFIYTKENGIPVLKSVNGQPCDVGENFTVIIQFIKNPDMSDEPQINFLDECELRIEMLHPSVPPSCTLKQDGNLINLRPLSKIPNISVLQPESKNTFSLGICKKSPGCGEDISVCEITTNNNSIPISDLLSQRISYKHDNLIIKGHFGEKRRKKQFELILKCNWKIKDLSNVIYVKPQNQGKTYKFKGESSHACIKFPMNCLVRDKHKPYFLYDLRSLHKNSDDWVVKNVDGGQININVCGPLHWKDKGNDCFDQYSQVCNVNDNGQIQNLGSIPKNILVTTDDTVKASFDDGSICLKNSSLTYSTEIEFICKSIEQGPILNSTDECTYKIKWHTPAACPINSAYGGDDCLISDLTGSLNLNKMYKSDRFIQLSPNSMLRYNLCGPLKQLCNSVNQSSVCYMENKKEYVVGYFNKILSTDNDFVTLNMVGDKCSSVTSNTKIRFSCNHVAPQDGLIHVKIIRDKCVFLITIETPLACPPLSFSNCVFSNHNLLYDLSSLSLNDSNYVVKDEKNIYILNACRSVIKKDKMLCGPYTAICMENVTEPHIKNKYLSLGRINQDVVPTYEEKDLIVTYKFGSMCAEPESFDHSSSIRFQCSQINEPPKLLKKSACHHEFIWRTTHACPMEKSVKPRAVDGSCEFTDSNGIKIDLSSIHTKINLTKNGDTYEIDLCTSSYIYCSGESGENCTSKNAKANFETKLGHKYISYHLSDACDNNDIKILQFDLICQPLNGKVFIETVNVTNCIYYINLKSQHLCTDEELNPTVKYLPFLPSVMEKTNLPSIPSVIEKTNLPSTHSIIKETNLPSIGSVIEETNDDIEIMPLCLISKLNNFKLSSLVNRTIASTSSTVYDFNFYVTNFNCNGVICKNGVAVIPRSSTCPVIQFNSSKSIIQLDYKSEQTCSKGFYSAKIWLKCNSELNFPSIIEESDCNVIMQYPLQEVCLLFDATQDTLKAESTGLVVGSSVGVAIIILAVTLVVVQKRYGLPCRKRYHSVSDHSVPVDKENTLVYCKDTKC